MIYPEDKQFLVNTKVSTILQFRVLDYGMERCTLTFSLPTPEGLADPHHSKAVALGGPIHLSIWRLDSSEPLEPSSLSWSNRPPRRRDAMEFYVQPEGSLIESEEFRCPAGSLQTYEVACSPRNSDCYIWFQQDHKEPRLALYLTQKQSKPPSL
ncbi:hypothetical protein AX16_009929 [Volvariella volvacea WC 439]|nr:hypothetical protein AX16_009929 [Volvariella volvacea WC 439]